MKSTKILYGKILLKGVTYIKEKKQYFIPCVKAKDLISADYDFWTESREDYAKMCISTADSPLLQQLRRLTDYHGNHPKEIVQVLAPHNKKKHKEYSRILGEGFYFNGIKFLRFGKSASQSKAGLTVFVADYVYDQLYEISTLGIDMTDKQIVIPKYEAQRCLIFSTCDLLNIPLPRICIVDSYSKIVPNQKIRYVEEVEKINDEGKTYKVREIKDGYRDIKITPWDGCGVSDISLHQVAQETLGLDYRPVGLQIRLPFMKGFTVEFPFREWFAEQGVSEIKDVFGNIHKVDEIDCIWNTDMWKGFGYFKDEYGDQGWDKYVEVCNKYDFKIGISKYSHHVDHINLKARMNFQYIQCLDLWNPKYIAHFDKLYEGEESKYDVLDEANRGRAIDLAHYTTDLFGKVCGGSKFHMLKFMGIGNSAEDKISSAFLQSVLINEDMLKDPAVKRYVKRKAQKKIDQAKLGKVYVDGFYHTVYGDLIGYLEYIIGKEPKGVLKWGDFFADTIYKNGETVLSFRSPLMCPSEVNKVTMVTELEDRWFGHLKGQDVCMINCHDLSAPIQGGIV